MTKALEVQKVRSSNFHKKSRKSREKSREKKWGEKSEAVTCLGSAAFHKKSRKSREKSRQKSRGKSREKNRTHSKLQGTGLRTPEYVAQVTFQVASLYVPGTAVVT